MNDILDLHTHTIACGHAYNTLFEMIQGAADKGVALFGTADHTPSMPGTCSAFYFSNLVAVPREVFGVKVLRGCELNITDYQGSIDLPERVLTRLDYAVASIHEPCYRCGTPAQNTSAIVGAIENPYVTIIGHPDDSRFPLEYPPIIEAAKAHGKLLEVNNSSLAPGSVRFNARENYKIMLELCMKHQVSVIVDSDAHVVTDVGNHRLAMELLEEMHFPEELVVNTSLDRLAAFLPICREI